MSTPLLVVGAALLLVAAAPAAAKFPHDMREYIDMDALERLYGLPQVYDVPMRDGVRLSTVVVLPRGADPNDTFAAVIDRSPYGHIGTELLTTIFLPFGFAAVLQDLRGSGESEGSFTFWRSDGTDAYDTMEWIAQQPWSNGRVYQIGFSADGNAALATINESPPWLKGQWISWASATGYNSSYQGGAWVEGLLESWLRGSGFPETIDEVKANEQYSDWWNPIDITFDKEGKCRWPTRMWAGWYDIFQQGNIEAFLNYQDQRSGCGGQHKLFIDAHGHCGGFDAGETYFPLSRLAIPIFEAIDLFLAQEGKPPRFASETDAVTMYVMGPGEDATLGNYWTTLPDFPKFTQASFYFRANGVLVRDRVPETTGRTSFVYDPSNPQPTLGGHLLSSICGQYDQRQFESRSDVLVFSTDVFTEPLVVTGRMNATLWVSTSANDTDIYVKLLDVYPDGRAMFLADGIRRLRWRYDREKPSVPTQPYAIYEVTLDLWSTSYIFEAGHSLRVHVSSSSYKRFSANYNNALPENDKERGGKIVATNTLFHSPEYPSRLELPIVTLDDIPNNFRGNVPDAPELAPWRKLLFGK